MSLLRVFLIPVCLIALTPPLHAQSLVDAAAAEAARRGTTKPADGKKVYSNKDLPAASVNLPPLAPPATATVDGPRTLPTSSDPVVTSVTSAIRTGCAKQWPDDFKMRAYCESQQVEALTKIAARNDAGTMKTPDGLIIRGKCMRQWQTDFKMANYCEEQQLKALTSLGR